ncbi:MAG TPA: ATP-binding protein, partial [Kofleriaceae bacterium]|nr:ATP-binding protein [Kofleriaceae bacterium]
MTAEERYRRKLLDEFRRTALDRIARISVLWIGFENAPADQDVAEELLRELHTMKGEARMMGFSDLGLLMHRLEEIAVWAQRLGGRELPPELGDLVMDANDVAGQLLGTPGAPAAAADLAGVFERIDRFLDEVGASEGAGEGESEGAGEGERGEGEGEGEGAEAPRRSRGTEASESWLRTDEAFLRVDVGEVAAFSESTFDLRVRARRVTGLARRIVQLVAARRDLLIELERGERRPISARRPPGPERGSPHSAERARARRPLAELVGELLPLCAGLEEEAEEAEVLLGELDVKARDLRLVPIATLFDRYVRVVRELAREHGKEVVTKVRDAGVRLDKALIDRLTGPLVHLLRNAIDHGLEVAEERQRAGKPRAGCITFSAERRGSLVSLTLADDGRGIDLEAVRTRAVELGLVGAEEARALGTAELLRLVFQPGVSTRRTVTQTSGRGVGLDAVKRELERLGGQVRVHAEAGQGTAIELQLPVSVAFTSVLVICLGDARFALPSSAISAVLTAGAADLEQI